MALTRHWRGGGVPLDSHDIPFGGDQLNGEKKGKSSTQKCPIWIGDIGVSCDRSLQDTWVFPKIGDGTPQMDGENNGIPY